MDTVHECDRQTDGRTERRTDRITITKTVQRRASHGNDCFMTYSCMIGSVEMDVLSVYSGTDTSQAA